MGNFLWKTIYNHSRCGMRGFAVQVWVVLIVRFNSILGCSVASLPWHQSNCTFEIIFPKATTNFSSHKCQYYDATFLLLRWIHDRRLSYLDYAQQPICLLPTIVTFTSNKTPAKSQHDYQLQNSSALWKLKNIPRDFLMENFRPPATFDISAQTKCQTLFSKDKHTQLCCCKQPSEIKYTLLIQSRLAYCFWANRGVRTFSMCTPHTTSNFVFCGNENNFWVENSFMPLTSHISHRTSCVNLSGGILWIM